MKTGPPDDQIIRRPGFVTALPPRSSGRDVRERVG
jgi:hypothetical protein